MVSSAAVICFDDPSGKGDRSPLMLRPLLFSPVAVWLVGALQAAGVERFLLLAGPAHAEELIACFPLGTQVCDPDAPDLGETVRTFAAETEGNLVTITRPVWLGYTGAEIVTCAPRLPRPDEEPIGIFRVTAERLRNFEEISDLERGIPFSPAVDGAPLCLPLQSAEDLLYIQDVARLDYGAHLMQNGVRMIDPGTVYIDPTVTVGSGCVLLPNVILRGNTVIGEDCEIGPDTMIRDCVLGQGCVANSSQLNEAEFGRNVVIGPFAYVRPGTKVADGCKVGDFVEVKNSVIGAGTKLPHLIYAGDADVGEGCNFGCGTVTCNYDGREKFRTTVGNGVFLGCNTNLVAPVTVGDGAYTAAGSTITEDVPADALAVARARQIHREGWVKRRREES